MDLYDPVQLKALKPGDHVALLYRNEEEHSAVIEPFIRDGLEKGQKVVYVAETHDSEVILDCLRKAEFDVTSYLDSGQLVVQGPEEIFVRDGVFDPHGTIELMKQEIEQAVAQGYTGLRVTSEMSWALREPPGCEQLIEYEARLCELCEDVPCLTLCQYDQRHFGSDLLLDVLQTHRAIILGTEPCHNFYYFPLAALTGHSLAAARYDIWTMNLLRFNTLLKSGSEGEGEPRRSEETNTIRNIAGGVAHDLSSLLMAISGHAEILLGKAPLEDPWRFDVQGILKASREAGTLVNQLLAFGRRQMPRSSAMNLNAVVTSIQSRLVSTVREGIEVITVLEPTLELIKADLHQMEEVVMNLAGNACDSMPEQGKLTIATENVTLTEKHCEAMPDARPGKFIRLMVGDTGVGMSEETRKRIFDPFFTTKEGAKGLGLSAVYGIVKQHDGWVDARSEPGQGSVFSVYIPILSAESAPEIRVISPSERLPGKGECVLVVEDEHAARGWITHLLRGSGYETIEAASVEEALEIFDEEKRRIKLVLTDVALPGRGGVELIRELLSINPDLRVVLSSSYAQERFKWEDVLKREIPFIEKPYTRVELLRKIKETLSAVQESKEEA